MKSRNHTPPGRRARILVVDSDVNSLLTVTGFLNRTGLPARGTPDGRHALAVLADYENEIDLVIASTAVTATNGASFLGACSAAFPDLPIIALAESPRGSFFGKDEFFAYLERPYERSHLLHVVSLALQQASAVAVENRGTRNNWMPARAHRRREFARDGNGSEHLHSSSWANPRDNREIIRAISSRN